MAKSNNQKAKILYLERRLLNTSEEQPVSMREILAMLKENDICAERKSIYDDMEVLREMGMNIVYRRERPSGYYLVNDSVDENEPSEEEAEMNQPMIKIRLLYDACVEKKVRKFFGENAEYKEKSSGELIVTAMVADGPELYGWLTSLGKNVHILKSKKLAQAYRSYLKSLVKEYKGI